MGAGQLEESVLEFGQSIEAPAQATELMQPGDGALHATAEHPRAAAVRCRWSGINGSIPRFPNSSRLGWEA